MLAFFSRYGGQLLWAAAFCGAFYTGTVVHPPALQDTVMQPPAATTPALPAPMLTPIRLQTIRWERKATPVVARPYEAPLLGTAEKPATTTVTATSNNASTPARSLRPTRTEALALPTPTPEPVVTPPALSAAPQTPQEPPIVVVLSPAPVPPTPDPIAVAVPVVSPAPEPAPAPAVVVALPPVVHEEPLLSAAPVQPREPKEPENTPADAPAPEGSYDHVTTLEVAQLSALAAPVIFPGTAEGVVGDLVFLDANANGIFDPPDTGISDAVLDLYRDADNSHSLTSPDTLLQTTTTNASGNYQFTGIADIATTLVVLRVPAGHSSTHYAVKTNPWRNNAAKSPTGYRVEAFAGTEVNLAVDFGLMPQ
ncbi:hypothetical protein H6771_01840 [Candidatus Peribacteria bacterium]|nr:hypothetical protein [Candidatus Peribacteria bacterium]